MTMTAAPGWLREELVTLAWCWRLARRDGVVMGLTSHDRDLLVGGVVYRAAPGMKPSAIETRDEIDAATMDIEGAIASAAIAARDLDAGRWDGAELTLSVTDWTAPDAAPVTVARGVLGAIERRGGAFAAELQGVTRALDRPVCPATSPSCRAMLGDRACRVDLAPRTHVRRVVAVDGRAVTLDEAVGAGPMAFGELMWMAGVNCGLASAVIGDAGAVLTLAEGPPVPPELPVRVRLTEGCDRQLATCRDRFANAANFRGEAHLPGNDLLMVGARFRAQGHEAASGLDCVGLVCAAYAAAGVRLVRPRAYPLRGWPRTRVEAGLAAAGFTRVCGAVAAGDVALVAFPAGQFHLGLIGPASFVHAHAGLRRVVETVLGDELRAAERWRFGGGG